MANFTDEDNDLYAGFVCRPIHVEYSVGLSRSVLQLFNIACYTDSTVLAIVNLSVCLSVCLSHAGTTVSTWSSYDHGVFTGG